ncbi:MAG: glycosyltransferase family 2 protein [Bacteroidia bacterium]
MSTGTASRFVNNVFRLLPFTPRILAYQCRFHFKKLLAGFQKPSPGISILLVTHNRAGFLKMAIEAVMTTAKLPCELIILDNASTDDTRKVVEAAITKGGNAVIRYVPKPFNYGTNGYALAFLHSTHDIILEMDDDILALQEGWDIKLVQCFKDFPDLGFVALDVIQDKYTNGAKHEKEKYIIEQHGSSVIQTGGPVGGWCTATRRSTYYGVNGFIFLPDKPFRVEDGNYAGKITGRKLRCAILYEVYAYHATGPLWNVAGKYEKVWKEKYSIDFREGFMNAIDDVDRENIPDFSVPLKAIREKELLKNGIADRN